MSFLLKEDEVWSRLNNYTDTAEGHDYGRTGFEYWVVEYIEL